MCISFAEAKSIMGQNLWSPGEVMESSPVIFSKSQIADLEKDIPFSHKDLESRAEKFALVPGQTLNLAQVFNLIPDTMKHNQDQLDGPWFIGQTFAENNQLDRNWYLVSLGVANGTAGKSFKEAKELLAGQGDPPFAVELAYLSMLYFAKVGKVLYKKERSFCSDLTFEPINGKGHFQFGFFGHSLDVRRYADMEKEPNVGMAGVCRASQFQSC